MCILKGYYTYILGKSLVFIFIIYKYVYICICKRLHTFTIIIKV